MIEHIKNKFGYIIVMRSDAKKTEFKPIPKRWIMERTSGKSGFPNGLIPGVGGPYFSAA